MTDKKHPPESDDKGAESEETIGRFETLARQLIKVRPEQLARERRAFEEERPTRTAARARKKARKT